jgi:hypothetical protein
MDVDTWRDVAVLWEGAGMAGCRRGPSMRTVEAGNAVKVRSGEGVAFAKVVKGGGAGNDSASYSVG